MSRRLGVLAATAALAAAAGVWYLVAPPHSASADRRAAGAGLPPAARAGETVFYGRIKSLTRKGRRYELRLDPAYWLSGKTAQRAAVDDGVLRPGEPVPNDVYIRDESHRLLTFSVPATARASVVTHGPGGVGSTRVSVAELAQIVRGRNPRRRPIFGPGLGFWVRVSVDTVRSLDQQYHP